MIDQRLLDEVQKALEPGEELLWAGRPEPFRFVRAKIVPMLVGALFLLLFFLIYRSSLSAPGVPENAAAQSITLRAAILLIGGMLTLYSCLLPVLAYGKARRTAYMATDRRIASFERGRLVKTIRYEDMQPPVLDHDGNSGDIWFPRKFRADAADFRIDAPLFTGVREADRVHQLVLERIAGNADEQTAYQPVQDYLELLLQGRKTVEDERRRI
ncbi:MAG: hypothetical protein ACYC7L_02770 [Nitrospirota bacterium]